jgi:predicted murein hydrolase (TIGR00659 family)
MTENRLPISEIWVYLSGTPLFALILTLSAYQLGIIIYEKTNKNPIANPVGIAVIVVACALYLGNISYAKYFEGAQFIHFLLGTATVALAVPIFNGYAALRKHWLALVTALICGAITSIASATLIAKALGADLTLITPLLAKSVTAPIAMGVAERLGASPTLTAVFAIVTGIIGASIGRFVLDAVGCKLWWQRGFSLGTAAHGIGTSRAFSVNAEAGTFASLAMGLHGVLGALLIPFMGPPLIRLLSGN